MATWLFVRHGQSEANAQGWYSGHLDAPLTELGRLQADALVEALADHAMVRIVSSDLQRAADTVRPVARARGLRVQTTPALRERHLGDWTRRRVVDAPDDLRDVLYSVRRRPPAGESLADVAARAILFLAALPAVDGPTLVGGHGGLLRILLGLIDGLDEAEIPQRSVSNGEVFARDVTPARWRALLDRVTRAVPTPEAP